MTCLRLPTKIVQKCFFQFHATLPLFLPPNSGHLDQTLDYTLGLPFDMIFCRRQNICHLCKIPILKAFYICYYPICILKREEILHCIFYWIFSFLHLQWVRRSSWFTTLGHPNHSLATEMKKITWMRPFLKGFLFDALSLPYTRHYNPLLIWNHSQL